MDCGVEYVCWLVGIVCELLDFFGVVLCMYVVMWGV